MKKLYQQIWDVTKPIYLEGRTFDADHIEWMLSVADEIIEKEDLDEKIFIPLTILHDIGYSKVDQSKFWQKDIRKGHMEIGAVIAEEILEKLNYPKDKIERIKYYISVHDNWALGNNEIYKNDRLLAIFTDLDFLWMASEKGFKYFMEDMKKSPKELLDWLENNEKLINRPFASRLTKELFGKMINERKEQYLLE